MAKGKKDPNKPKRGLSAFMYFSQEKRAELKEEIPTLGFGEIGKELGKRWKELDPAAKKKYQDKAAEDKKRYMNAMKDYAPADDDKPKKGKKSGSKKSKKDEEDEEEEEGDDE